MSNGSVSNIGRSGQTNTHPQVQCGNEWLVVKSYSPQSSLYNLYTELDRTGLIVQGDILTTDDPRNSFEETVLNVCEYNGENCYINARELYDELSFKGIIDKNRLNYPKFIAVIKNLRSNSFTLSNSSAVPTKLSAEQLAAKHEWMKYPSYSSNLWNKLITGTLSAYDIETLSNDQGFIEACNNSPYLRNTFNKYRSNLISSQAQSNQTVQIDCAKSNGSYIVSRGISDREIKITCYKDNIVRIHYETITGVSSYVEFSQQNAAYDGFQKTYNLQLYHVLRALPTDVKSFSIQISPKNNIYDVQSKTDFILSDPIETSSHSAGLNDASPLYDAVKSDIINNGKISAVVYAGPENSEQDIEGDALYKSFENINYGLNAREQPDDLWTVKSITLGPDGTRLIKLSHTVKTHNIRDNRLRSALLNSRPPRNSFDIEVTVVFSKNSVIAGQNFSKALSDNSADAPRFIFFNGHNLHQFPTILTNPNQEITAQGAKGVAMFCCYSDRLEPNIPANYFPTLTKGSSDASGYLVRIYFKSFFNTTAALFSEDMPQMLGNENNIIHNNEKFTNHYQTSIPDNNNDSDWDHLSSNVDPDDSNYNRSIVSERSGHKNLIIFGPNPNDKLEIHNVDVNYFINSSNSLLANLDNENE